MNSKKITAFLTALVMCTSFGSTAYAQQSSTDITIYPSEGHKSISPYIYGVNSGVDLTEVSAGAFRLGGNRLTAYNWENNVSNAGSDWKNSSDMYLTNDIDDKYKKVPAGAVLSNVNDAQKNGVPYTLVTLQMQGHTASDLKGSVPIEGKAPSEYWFEVVNRKGSEFSLEPDDKDNYVYMDEYLNYLITTLGNSKSKTGIKAYALDNEPSLWHHTHSLIQQNKLSCDELVDKSVDLSKVIKEMDSDAEVFGPSLFGYSAFDSLAGAPDWNTLKTENNYRWFIDYYLDEMKKAENEYGTRLLDVLDIHYYTEAKGACGQRSCNHYDNDDCVKARLDSVRSLYEEGYLENSWIVDTGAEFFPLLPNLQQSIDKYYPDTKIAFTEYNFGGGDHISGAVVQTDMLGIFAEYGVYFASIWSFDNNEFQISAINMFTNYDGKGSGFGNTLVKSEYENENISVYSSIDGNDEGKVKIIVTNRSLHEDTPVNISLSADKEYVDAEVYSLNGENSEIQQLKSVDKIIDNAFSYTLPPLSVTEFIVSVEEPDNKNNNSTKNIPLIAGTGVGAVAVIGVASLLIRRKIKSKEQK